MNTINLRSVFCTKILAWLLMSTILLFSGNTLAAYPGTYNHETQTAFIYVFEHLSPSIEDFSQKRIILSVDFKSRKITHLASGKNLSWITINHDNTILSYSDDKGTHFIDAKDGHSLFNVKMTMLGGAFWAVDENILAMEGISVEPDKNNRYILEIDVDHRKMKSAKLNNTVWYIKWSKNCTCFLYEISAGLGNKRYTARLQDHKLHNLKTRKNLTLSNDGKYYYSVREESDDEPGKFEVFRTRDNKSIMGEYTAVSTPRKSEVLWGNDTLRVLNHQSLFDLTTGKLVSPPLWFSKEGIPVLYGSFPYIDEASDRSQYVLRWNYGKRHFEVEDINTGNIVRTYEKFW